MSDIRLARAHQLPLSRAKAVAQAAADELARDYDCRTEWRGDTLHFSRLGVQGQIDVSPSQIALEVRLGLLLRAFRGTIEHQVRLRLDASIDGAAAGVRAVPRVPAPDPGAGTP